jgi:hypothetical protein
LQNLFAIYLPAVDTWDVYDNADLSGPRLIATGGRDVPVTIGDGAAWTRLSGPSS